MPYLLKPERYTNIGFNETFTISVNISLDKTDALYEVLERNLYSFVRSVNVGASFHQYTIKIQLSGVGELYSIIHSI